MGPSSLPGTMKLHLVHQRLASNPIADIPAAVAASLDELDIAVPPERVGMTEQAMGMPICSSMEVVEVGQTATGAIAIDKHCYESDGVLVLHRVKLHTSFTGRIEKGISRRSSPMLGAPGRCRKEEKPSIPLLVFVGFASFRRFSALATVNGYAISSAYSSPRFSFLPRISG